jgi:xylulose-5-phosphate/fructose-6-phosphate phosphoketolase
VNDVIDRVPKLASRAAYAKQAIRDKLIDHKQYIQQYGDDMPAISGWTWNLDMATGPALTSTEGDNV